MRMVLIIGGSGSGKSAFAESYLLHHAKEVEVLAGIPNLWKGCGISDDAM